MLLSLAIKISVLYDCAFFFSFPALSVWGADLPVGKVLCFDVCIDR